jgi:hypothetical protein
MTRITLFTAAIWLIYGINATAANWSEPMTAQCTFYLTMTIITAGLWIWGTAARLKELSYSPYWVFAYSVPFVFAAWALNQGPSYWAEVAMIFALAIQCPLLLNPSDKQPGKFESAT